MNHPKTKQINHDNHHTESKIEDSQIQLAVDDGDPWAPNNLLKSVAGKFYKEGLYSLKF